MNGAGRSFAIVPACGQSRRMGTDKLTLPWQNSTILETVIEAWLASQVDHVLVVIPAQRADLRHLLAEKSIEIVLAESVPPDMKGTVQLGLAKIAENFQPNQEDVWLVAPADMPTLSPKTIDAILAQQAKFPKNILVPVCGDQRGHPALFPWKLSERVFRLASDEGIKSLFRQDLLQEVPVSELGKDANTPQELQDLRERYER